MTGEQLGDAYRAINPECTVPALVLDDGTVLTEVIGMCTYLEGLYPDKPLLGTTPLEKAQVISWDHKLFLGVMMSVASMLREGNKAFRDRALPGALDLPQIPELVDRGQLQLQDVLPKLDAHLKDNQWVTGDNLTFADIDLLVCINFMAWVKQSVPENCTNLKAWYERASAELT
jgi:glutathione S-transferase